MPHLCQHLLACHYSPAGRKIASNQLVVSSFGMHTNHELLLLVLLLLHTDLCSADKIRQYLSHLAIGYILISLAKRDATEIIKAFTIIP